MTTIGSLEAKRSLSRLLERVQQGERFVITKRGAPVAQLVPLETPRDQQQIEDTINRIKAFRATRPRTSARDIREMLEEGRR